ncbi:hypothetical protein ACFL96_12090 [Thermoproteota archaeon]
MHTKIKIYNSKSIQRIALCFTAFLFILIILPSAIAGTKLKGVQGHVLIPNGSAANNASVRVHVIASGGIGASIPCTTDPPVTTSSSGYYITDLSNLKKDSDSTDCGDTWHGGLADGDPIWAVVNGSTVIPIPYSDANSSQTTIPSDSGESMWLDNTTLVNTPPQITSVSASPSPISGGNQTTITSSGQTDQNQDDLSLLCCFSTSTCEPLTTNQCTGNWENISYPYTGMNCTWTAPIGVDAVYNARCRVKDYQNYSSIVTTTVTVDDLAPVTYDSYAYNNTWVNSDQAITISPDCGSTSCTWTKYCTENATCTPYLTYSGPISFTNENISYLRYHSNDTFGRVQDIVTNVIKIDKGAPIIDTASVSIENNAQYTNLTTISITWSGFSDNLSGINGYYYSFSNNQGTTSGTYDTTSPGLLSGASQGLVYVYIWAVDSAGNLGFSVSDSIIVDSIGPTISNVISTPINQTSTFDLEVNATINDSVMGFNITPTIEYRYGSGAWTSPINMTKLSGNDSIANYTHSIPKPGSDWTAYRGENVYWNITVVDKLGNIRETQYSTNVVSINLLTFNVKDSVLGIWLQDVTITGGTQCSSGCLFNNSINISELNGNYEFTITKTGFSTNVTNINVDSQDYVLNIGLDDAEQPQVSFINYSISIGPNGTYYAKVYADISDNFNLDTKVLDYVVSGFISDSGQEVFNYVSGTTYYAEVGYYDDSMFMESSIFVNDSHGLSINLTLDDVWYVFINGSSIRYSTGDNVLSLKQGWNLISVPLLKNHTVESVLDGLSNGIWGCGRTSPGSCDPSVDYVGDFTKIMRYNKSNGIWISFNPTDYYLAIDDQELDDIDAKKGYWINMSVDQDLTLDLKFD